MPTELLPYLKLFGIAMVPVGLTLVLYLLQKLTMFGRMERILPPTVGLIFGAASAFATQYALPIGGAVISTADIAPLCAGLMFSGPSGIIAGILGGAYRYFAVSWGADAYTMTAEVISIVFAGLFAAFLRGKLFDRKTPAWGAALFMGIVTEVVHMTFLFITRLSDSGHVFELIKSCTIPMVFCAALALMIASLLLNLVDLCVEGRRDHKKTITQKIQGALIVVVLIAYLVTTLFVYILQTSTADFNAASVIDTSIGDIRTDLVGCVDDETRGILHTVCDEYEKDPDVPFSDLSAKYKLSELHFIGETGIIRKSNSPSALKRDVHKDEYSSEFLVLLGDKETECLPECREVAVGGQAFLRKYAGIKTSGGYLMIGIDYAVYADAISATVRNFAENRHIGNEGYLLIADRDQTVISGKYAGKTLTELGIDPAADASYSDIRKATVNGVPSVFKFEKAEGYYLLGIMSESEVYGTTREASTYVNSFMLIIIFAVIFMMIFFVIKRVVLKDIKSIRDDVATIAAGDLGVWLHNNSTSEFSSLSDGINQAVATLKRYNEEEKARFEKELELAKNIQYSALPTVFPAPTEYNIYANMRTAKEVGGDFYDFYMVDKTHLVFMIADVSGKGVPAAMFMMTAKTMLKNMTESGITENEVFNRANDKLCENNDAGMFVTAWMGILDTQTGHVEFVNAGHNPPIIYRSGREYDYLQCKSGFVLSGLEGAKYKVQEFDMEPGDKILLYTDGVTEATNLYNTLYGEDRLKKYLNTVKNLDVAATISGVLKSIDKFVGKADQFDDITMVMVQYNGPIPTAKKNSPEDAEDGEGDTPAEAPKADAPEAPEAAPAEAPAPAPESGEENKN